MRLVHAPPNTSFEKADWLAAGPLHELQSSLQPCVAEMCDTIEPLHVKHCFSTIAPPGLAVRAVHTQPSAIGTIFVVVDVNVAVP